ncbi:MAG: hypothetical protein EGP89_02415 [Ruminococcaceae bacterium]|nr:hypothetical protein [Oscillospiraceae bacterium]
MCSNGWQLKNAVEKRFPKIVFSGQSTGAYFVIRNMRRCFHFVLQPAFFCGLRRFISSVIFSLSQQNSRTVSTMLFTDVKTESTEKFEENIAKYCKKGIDIHGVLC